MRTVVRLFGLLTIVGTLLVAVAAFPWPNPERRELATQCMVGSPSPAGDGLRARLDFILRQGPPTTPPCLAYQSLQIERLTVGAGIYLGLAAGLFFLALGSILKRLRIRQVAEE